MTNGHNGQGGWQPPPQGAPVGGQPVPPQQQSPAGPAFDQPANPGFAGQQPPTGFQNPPPQTQQGYGGQQPNYAQNPFAGITSGDQSNQRHPFLEDGDYKLKISAIKFVNARSGKMHYIIEGDIIESNNPLRPVGMRVACFINMSNKDTAGKHCAAFVSSVFGIEPAELPKDSPNAPWADQQTGQQMPWAYYLEMSIHDSQPWVGMEVGVNVTTIQTQATGADFSLHTWHPAASFTVPPVPAGGQQQAVPPPPQAQQGQQWAPPPQQGAPAPQTSPAQQAPQGAAPQQGYPPQQGGGWGGPQQG